MNDNSSYSADYYSGRERAEREMADQAKSTAIRKIHLEMAARYRELAKQAEQSNFPRHALAAGAPSAQLNGE